MNRLVVLLFLCLCLATSASAEVLLLQADGYIDVREGKRISPANIVVENGRISAINPGQLPTDAKVIDLGDLTLLPGLMDMHVHLDLDFDGSNFGVVTRESGAEGALRAARNAERTLMAGFTTVRNVGQVHPTLDLIDVALAHAIEAGWLPGPRVVPAGHMITILGGHADLSMAEGLAEGMLEQGPTHGIVSGVDDAIKATRFQLKHGAKVIKIHATAGVMSLEDQVGAQQLSNDEMRAIVEEAHRHEIPVAAHAHGTDGIKAAIRAGVDSIEHGSMLDDEAIKMMKENDVTLVPTSGLMDLIDFDSLDPKKRAKAEFVAPKARESLSAAIDAGVPVALGSDAPLIPHGQNAYELKAMVNRGMTPAQALQSATIVSAKLIRRDDLGELKVGTLADIIAVDGDPLEDVGVVESVGFVMKGGVVFRRQR